MLHDAILARAADERRFDLLAEAEAARTARRTRTGGRGYDPAEVLIRPIRGEDGPLLRDGFLRLSPRSRRLRFLSSKADLSPAEVRYFTDVDHERHEALVAVHRRSGTGLAVARYIRDLACPETADVAVTVVDEWQGRGLGPDLLHQLIRRARRSGVCRFTALVSAENDPARRAMAKLGVPMRIVQRDGPTASYELTIASPCGCS
jgi:GNAT superfamily N-acetyltransferase